MLATPDPASGAGIDLLKIDAVKRRTGLGRTTIYELAGRGDFPLPRHVSGTRISVWASHEVDRWIAAQLAGGARG